MIEFTISILQRVCDHDQNSRRSKQRGHKVNEYVEDKEPGDATIDPQHMSVVFKKIDQVHDSRRDPTAPLVVILVESLGCVGHRVSGGHVANEVALLDDKGAEPAVLSLVVLDEVVGFVRFGHIDW